MPNTIDLAQVGAFPTLQPDGSVSVEFGLYLPDITAAEGYRVVVRVIHDSDRFDPAILPVDFDLQYVDGSPLDLWSGSFNLAAVAGTHFGTPGTYLYRYQLWQQQPGTASPQLVTLWFTDPFARATDIGELGAFTTPGAPDFVWTDAGWRTPDLDDLVIYELNVEEFNGTFDGVVERIPYLQSLGVNVLELMPVSSLKLDFDWGYGPLHYIAPNARCGGPLGLKNLVNACHAAGVAVILDVVYQHVDYAFPYSLVYANARKASPMIGPAGDFGPTIDFSQQFAQDYVGTVNTYLLNEFHVDGFRYDEVTDLYVSPTDTAYAKLAYDTYNASLAIPRFQGAAGGYSRIIQVAEALYKARTVLANTYTSAAWPDDLLYKSEDMAQNGNYVDDAFVPLLDPYFGTGYPATKLVQDAAGNPVAMPVAPVQYLESHDHSQLIAFAEGDPNGPGYTARDTFYKLQPFAIALYSCQGVPMLWEGQEFADSWTLPANGSERVGVCRDVHWEYFYDAPGSAMISLYRRLGALRKTYRALRSRQSYYYYLQSNTAAGAVAYHRLAAADGALPEQVAVVFLNFSNNPATLTLPFPAAGRYRELLDDGFRTAAGQPSLDIDVAAPGEPHSVNVPSNYGQIFITI
jgi:maltooligosyltrehalose trehalohydrolase